MIVDNRLSNVYGERDSVDREMQAFSGIQGTMTTSESQAGKLLFDFASPDGKLERKDMGLYERMDLAAEVRKLLKGMLIAE